MLFFQPRIKDTYMQDVMPVMWLGLWLNVFCVAFMLLLTFHPQLMRQILVKGHELLVKIHILKKKTSRLEKLENAMDRVSEDSRISEKSSGRGRHRVSDHLSAACCIVFCNIFCLSIFWFTSVQYV